MRKQLLDSSTNTADVSLAWSKLTLLVSAVETSLDKWLGDTYRVGLTEFRALVLLSQASDKELRVNDLAQRVGLNPSSATRLVHRLEAKGLARRDVCADDGRGVYAVIDTAGDAALHDMKSAYEARLQELLGNLDAHFPSLATGSTANALTQVAALLSE